MKTAEFDEFLAERLRILADAKALKEMARAFLHPEEPVVTSDSTACARCYFDRASGIEQESVEEAEYRAAELRVVYLTANGGFGRLGSSFGARGR